MKPLEIVLLIVWGILFLRQFWLFGRDPQRATFSLIAIIMLVIGIGTSVLKLLFPYPLIASFLCTILSEVIRFKQLSSEIAKFERVIAICFISLAVVSSGILIGSVFL
jgi:hypothetical protein